MEHDSLEWSVIEIIVYFAPLRNYFILILNPIHEAVLCGVQLIA